MRPGPLDDYDGDLILFAAYAAGFLAIAFGTFPTEMGAFVVPAAVASGFCCYSSRMLQTWYNKTVKNLYSIYAAATAVPR